MTAGCPKNSNTGNPIIFGGLACEFYRKNFLTWKAPHKLVYRKICVKCGLDITLHGILKEEESKKLIKPAILPLKRANL